jgi:hypothetical protein
VNKTDFHMECMQGDAKHGIYYESIV